MMNKLRIIPILLMIIGFLGWPVGIFLQNKLIIMIFGGLVAIGMIFLIIDLLVGFLIDLWNQSN